MNCRVPVVNELHLEKKLLKAITRTFVVVNVVIRRFEVTGIDEYSLCNGMGKGSISLFF